MNLRRADTVVINKVDTAKPADVEIVRRDIRQNNRTVAIVRMACKVSLGRGESIEGKRVLVVEDAHADSRTNGVRRGCRCGHSGRCKRTRRSSPQRRRFHPCHVLRDIRT